MNVYSEASFKDALARLRSLRPLVHCLTNEVVQEITADVLLAAGASPAMVVAREEAGDFAAIAQALLVNTGTPYPERIEAMRDACRRAAAAGRPWVLDPVAAGLLPWRDGVIREFLALKPAVVRGNASEIRALARCGTGGKGVDSTDTSDAALEPAKALAREAGCVVFVTGEIDYVTDGLTTVSIPGGSAMTPLVVGTGCALSALTAAYLAAMPTALEAACAASAHAKRAAEYAALHAQGPGSFKAAYLDGLYLCA